MKNNSHKGLSLFDIRCLNCQDRFNTQMPPLALQGDPIAETRRSYYATGRRCHGAHTAYEKNNRYAARSPRWFGGTSPALLFRMCCVSTAFQWRMGNAHAAHLAYEWRCHCVWCRVWELDNCVFTAQVAYARTRGGQHDSMAYGGRMYSAWAAYMPNLWIHLIICELWMWHLNVHVVEHICI